MTASQNIEVAGLQHRQRGAAIIGLFDILVTQIVQQVLYDPTHRREIIDDQKFQLLVQGISLSAGKEAFIQKHTTAAAGLTAS